MDEPRLNLNNFADCILSGTGYDDCYNNYVRDQHARDLDATYEWAIPLFVTLGFLFGLLMGSIITALRMKKLIKKRKKQNDNFKRSNIPLKKFKAGKQMSIELEDDTDLEKYWLSDSLVNRYKQNNKNDSSNAEKTKTSHLIDARDIENPKLQRITLLSSTITSKFNSENESEHQKAEYNIYSSKEETSVTPKCTHDLIFSGDTNQEYLGKFNNENITGNYCLIDTRDIENSKAERVTLLSSDITSKFKRDYEHQNVECDIYSNKEEASAVRQSHTDDLLSSGDTNQDSLNAGKTITLHETTNQELLIDWQDIENPKVECISLLSNITSKLKYENECEHKKDKSDIYSYKEEASAVRPCHRDDLLFSENINQSSIKDPETEHEYFMDITPDGGFCYLDNIDSVLFFQPGTVDSDVNVTITRRNTELIDNIYELCSHEYEFLPHGFQFKKPVLFRFPLTLQHQYDVNSLRILYFSDVWIELDPETCSDISWLFLHGFCYLYMKHFCKIEVVKTKSGNEMTAVPLQALLFAKPIEEEKYLRMAVTFSCAAPQDDCVKIALQETEKRLGENLDNRPIMVYENGSLVKIILAEYDKDNWTVYQKEEVLPDILLVKLCEMTRSVGIPKAEFNLHRNFVKAGNNYFRIEITQEVEDGQRSIFSLHFDMKFHSKEESQFFEPSRQTDEASIRRRSIGNKKSKIPKPITQNKKALAVRIDSAIDITEEPTHTEQCTTAGSNNYTLTNITYNYSPTYNNLSPKNNIFPLNNCLENQIWPEKFDTDFGDYLVPVRNVMDNDKAKLKLVARSLGIENTRGLDSQFLFSSWFLEEKDQNNDMWLPVLQALKDHHWDQARDEMVIALEKQMLKKNIGTFIRSLNDIQHICTCLYEKGILNDNQLKELPNMKRETAIQTLILNYLLTSQSKGFVVFKQVLEESEDPQEKELLKLMLLKHH